MSITNAELENLPKTFFKKKKIDPFLCNFVRPKTADKLSVNIDDVLCTHYTHTILLSNMQTEFQS